MDNNKPVGLASDHAGFAMKEYIRQFLAKKGVKYIDFGTYSSDSCNYAEYGHRLAKAVESGEVGRGIAVCGSGNGINMTLNKHRAIRSALCWNEEITRLTRAHNDANVLALPGRFIALEEAEKLVEIFLNTPFEGGRHIVRVEAIGG